jgi:hypothetical protein
LAKRAECLAKNAGRKAKQCVAAFDGVRSEKKNLLRFKTSSFDRLVLRHYTPVLSEQREKVRVLGDMKFSNRSLKYRRDRFMRLHFQWFGDAVVNDFDIEFCLNSCAHG